MRALVVTLAAAGVAAVVGLVGPSSSGAAPGLTDYGTVMWSDFSLCSGCTVKIDDTTVNKTWEVTTASDGSGVWKSGGMIPGDYYVLHAYMFGFNCVWNPSQPNPSRSFKQPVAYKVVDTLDVSTTPVCIT